jgi:NADH-quinone oxidoreductase subunit H
MFYLGPVFRLTGGVGLLLFVPTLYGNEMFANLPSPAT